MIWFGQEFFSETSGIFFSVGYFFLKSPTPLPQVESGVDYLIGSWSNGIFLGKISGYKQMFYLADTPHIVDKIRSSPGLRIRLAFLACLSQNFNYFVFEWP